MRPLAPAVADALEVQNACLAPSPRRADAIAQLRRGAAAVVTGQQVGLFLGPLYTLYKTVSAIRIATALAEASGRPVVPVFWLQTEDHDLPEIAACGLPLGVVRVAASADDRMSIAGRALPDEISPCIEELRQDLAGLPHAADHLDRLARHYRPGARWGDAFAGVLSELFAEEGLVFLDPRDPALAAAARPIHARALASAGEIAAALPAAPVHVRPGSPLSFFHPDGAAGPRYRLDPAGDGAYACAGAPDRRPCSTRELLEILEDDPRRFSTSALLRPILQDTLLPTAAYVGGPAEVAYFTQLPSLYASYGLPMPLVVQRARFRLIEPGVHKLLKRLDLEPSDSERPEEDLLARCHPRGDGSLPEGAVLARRLRAPFEAALAEAAGTLAAAAPHLPDEADRARAAVARAIERLTGKYDKALLHRDSLLVEDVRRLKAHLHPDGVPQERALGLPWFAACAGDRTVVERLLGAAVPFDAGLKDVYL